MRDNFKRFGGFICLDMMKLGIKKLLWIYVAFAMYNDLEEVFIGYEGLIIQEKIEEYEFVVTFICNNILTRIKEKVYVVSRDGICDKSIIERLGFENDHL